MIINNINTSAFLQKRVKLNQNTFVNPYTSRFNNGIPIYSQERMEERSRKVCVLIYHAKIFKPLPVWVVD